MGSSQEGIITEALLSRCGYRCDSCLAYKPNVEKNPSNQQKLSDGWYKYFGFRLQPEKICCDGCLAENPKLIDQTCQIRPCVIEKGLANCSFCAHYICDKLKDRLVLFEEIQSRFSNKIPEDDYMCFIQPYENKRRLDTFRATGEKTR